MKQLAMINLLLFSACALAQESGVQESEAQEPAAAAPAASANPPGPRTLGGMSILGNEEAPKSLVIVPWKSSQIGDGIAVNNLMDDRPTALDRDVFLRELRYYELRTASDN